MIDPTDVTPATWAIAGGRPADAPGEPLNVPPFLASNFVLGSDRIYTRNEATPGWEAFEEVIGGLEGGTAVAFASGMAACAGVLHGLPSGAHVVLPDDCYQGVAELAAAGAAAHGWRLERLAVTDPRVARPGRDGRRDLGRVAVQSDARGRRPRGDLRRAASGPAPASSSTTRSPRRCSSSRWRSAPTSSCTRRPSSSAGTPTSCSASWSPASDEHVAQLRSRARRGRRDAGRPRGVPGAARRAHPAAAVRARIVDRLAPRRAARGASGGRPRALSRFRRDRLVRAGQRRCRRPRVHRDAADPSRDQPRRRRDLDRAPQRAPRPGAHSAGAHPDERRVRGPRGPVARPSIRPRLADAGGTCRCDPPPSRTRSGTSSRRRTAAAWTRVPSRANGFRGLSTYSTSAFHPSGSAPRVRPGPRAASFRRRILVAVVARLGRDAGQQTITALACAGPVDDQRAWPALAQRAQKVRPDVWVLRLAEARCSARHAAWCTTSSASVPGVDPPPPPPAASLQGQSRSSQ